MCNHSAVKVELINGEITCIECGESLYKMNEKICQICANLTSNYCQRMNRQIARSSRVYAKTLLGSCFAPIPVKD